MNCEYGYNDCSNYKKKCDFCIRGMRYLQKKKKDNIKYARSNGRKGSAFEAENHNSNAELLSGAFSRLTPNSGAGNIKGDEEIQGIISCMEELKDGYNSRGENSFALQKDWLDKLEREAKKADKEFWYLKFRFKNQKKYYVTIDSDQFMGLLYTLQEDRKSKNKAEYNEKLSTQKLKVISQEKICLEERIKFLEEKVKLLELKNERR